MDCFSVLMEHTVTVSYLTTGTDAGGGTQNTATTRASGVACLLNVQGSKEEAFGQEQQTQSVTVATFYTGVQRGDKLTVTAGPSLVGASLHVESIKDQPGVSALGFDEIVHLTAKRIL